jgi:hypothetical protein
MRWAAIANSFPNSPEPRSSIFIERSLVGLCRL